MRGPPVLLFLLLHSINIFFTKYNRYAITDVETEVKNPNSEVQEAFFDMFIPEEAFVSKFSMKIKDQIYFAKVEIKEKAKDLYVESNENAGLLESLETDFNGTNHVRNTSSY